MNAQRRRDQIRGQMTIVFAVMATALLGFLALTIDGGYAFSQRRSLQNAADAASLAGTRQLASYEQGNPLFDANVYSAVQEAAENNGWSATAGSLNATYIMTNRVSVGTVGSFGNVAPPAAAFGVGVTLTKGYSTFFGGFIGLSTLTAQAEARSIFGYVCSANCLFPVAVYTQAYAAGVTYEMKDDGQTGPGNFGWIGYSGGSATDLARDLMQGTCASGLVDDGEWIPGSSGQSWSSRVLAQVDWWIGRTVVVSIYGPGPGSNSPCCSGGNCPATCGSGGNLEYHVVGFAAFRLLGYNQTTKTLTGEFLNYVADFQLSPGCASSSGIQAINLIR